MTEVHDLHVWTLVPGKDMVTAHLTSTAGLGLVLDDARAVLTARGLDHATVQVEPPDGAADCKCEARVVTRRSASPSSDRAAGSQSSSRSRQR